MEKIPTLFVRDSADPRHVTRMVTRGCEWVIRGEGIPTRKWDGTCVMYDGESWWARREVKPGKHAPDDFKVVVPRDNREGTSIGWVPAETSGFWKYLAEALDERGGPEIAPGTYELVGPKINGNPEGMLFHCIARHGEYLVSHMPDSMSDIPIGTSIVPGGPYALTLAPTAFTDPYDLISQASALGWEGIVWYHPDWRENGLRAKLKVRDIL